MISSGRAVWLLLAGLALLAAPAGAAGIRLRSGVLEGPHDTAGLVPHLRAASPAPQAGAPALLRFARPITPGLRQSVTAAGIRLVAYVDDRAFIAYLPQGADSLSSLDGIDWAAPLHPGLKLAPEIAAVSRSDPRDVVPVNVLVAAHFRTASVAERIAALGLDVRGIAQGRPASGRLAERPGVIVVLPSPAQLVGARETIARWPESIWIGHRPGYRLINDESAWVGQSGISGGQTTPVYANGIHGQGQTIGLFDSGLDADMCYFRDDVLGLPPTNSGYGTGTPDPLQRKVTIVNFLWPGDDPSDPEHWDDIGHGTHVTGSAAGDRGTPGVRDSGDGMAPAAKLVIQDGGAAPDACAQLAALGCIFADIYPIFDQAYLQGARVHSNSWGDEFGPTPNVYSVGSEDADAFTWDHPEFLILFAAGNLGSGAGTVGSPATAKNVVTVGATGGGSSAGNLWSPSSRGPALDGRLKPDLMAPGQSISSAASDFDVETNNCGTVSATGTSMASPTAAGWAALVRQYYEDGFYPTGSTTPADSLTPSAALLKATLIASAQALENVGTPPPSNAQGWGRVLLDAALYFPGDPVRLFVADEDLRFDSPANAHDVWLIDVSVGAPLRVVLAWTDYPSTPAAAINLVNDLNLEVESPTGSLYLGNVFSGGASQTGGTPDALNNVEAVRIEAPQAGTWRVRVRPTAIPQPSQGYALVANGADVTGLQLLAPNPVRDLRVARDGSDLSLGWSRPATDPGHGETESYRVYRSTSASGGFGLRAELDEPGATVEWIDTGAISAGPVLFYEVVAANEVGDADVLP